MSRRVRGDRPPVLKIDRALAFRLADEIVSVQRRIDRILSQSGLVDSEEARCLADLRDHFIFACLRVEKPEAREFVDLLEQLESRMGKAGDRFHAGFFFTLAQLLSLRFEIARLPGEKIGYEDWKRSFKETLRKLGIPLRESNPDLGELELGPWSF